MTDKTIVSATTDQWLEALTSLDDRQNNSVSHYRQWLEALISLDDRQNNSVSHYRPVVRGTDFTK